MKKLTKLLLTGILTLAGTLGGGYFSDHQSKRNNPIQIQEVTQANKKLRDFPEKIKGAKSITKYETPGAKYTLVHLRQTHYVDMGEELSLENIIKDDIGYWNKIKDIYTKINNCQKDIYDILTELRENQNVSNIRSEGVMVRDFDNLNNKEALKNEYFSKLAELDKKNYFPESIESCFRTMNHLEKYVKANKPAPFSTTEKTLKDYNNAKQNFEKFKYIAGSDFLLAIEDKLNILPAETLEAYDTNDNNIREYALLEIISKNNNPLELTVYGAKHNFKDNIKKWNKENPNKKYSLIEITPENLYSNKNK